MFYPLKFEPVYKSYIWGGRNLEKFGKVLPEGIVAESWEVSCHPDGVSIIANGDFKGFSLPAFVERFGRLVVGNALEEKDIRRFPLLVKLIDANEDLSVQVHPDDLYASIHEQGEIGKNEMWYILSAKPGAKLVSGIVPGTTKEALQKAIINDDNLMSYLKVVEVVPGDVINIPAGWVHALGSGIAIAEVQQNSNATYRIYDYNRTDAYGKKRPLHVEKALDVINFRAPTGKEKYSGLSVDLDNRCIRKFLTANRFFSVELYDIDGCLNENADGSRFYIYMFIEGSGVITYDKAHHVEVKMGESILIPASMGKYSMEGDFKALRAYVADVEANVLDVLRKAGYSDEEINDNVAISR